MDPKIEEGNIVLVDLTQNNINAIKDDKIYVICWDFSDGECAVKYLRWVEKGKILSIESANQFYKPIFRRVNEVKLIGQVLWSWRDH